jgi:hypothetical protein
MASRMKTTIVGSSISAESHIAGLRIVAEDAIESVRMVLNDSWFSAASVIGAEVRHADWRDTHRRVLAGSRSSLTQAAQMSRGVAERGAGETSARDPTPPSPNGPATETDDVHVIVLYQGRRRMNLTS